ncbi:hypothetical protein [Streptomyces palmae]|uniref:hypothetical protein n=1 Tax=Streptomyces palmae TaxID=1701085 RepID=UPI001432CA02|nr:hypothetical protein [Streptomyces palmae]
MPDMTGLSTELLAAADQGGPGTVLRVVILVGLLGAALVAWLLLRGYRRED